MRLAYSVDGHKYIRDASAEKNPALLGNTKGWFHLLSLKTKLETIERLWIVSHSGSKISAV